VRGVADLVCTGLAKSYGNRPVLVDVDLAVPTGTLTAILGASGSGKTTLLRVVIGFVPADRGTVRVGDDVVVDAGRALVPSHRRAIGYVAQEGALFPHLTVAGNVAFGLPRNERRAAGRVVDVLDLVGLDRSYAERRPHELSGGEQRRVALARALAPRPRLVLLDEPFSGLDPGLRAETREAVVRALAAEGTTGVLVTHDQSEALSMGREVAVLRSGRLVQTAPPAVLYRDPADLDVAEFVGDAVVLEGTAASGLVECALGTLPVRGTAVEGPVHVLIRPEQIRFAAGAGQSDVAEVVGSTYHGADTVVRLALPGGNGATVTARTFDQEVPAVGERVRVVVAGTVAVYPR
jgi:iron(III) transport system ATP-binding protein